MSRAQITLFEDQRLTLADAIDLTAHSLNTYLERYRHVALAFSGGKDSAATLATVIHLIESGRVPRPESLTVIYSDTRLELPPLQASAMRILAAVEAKGFGIRVVMPAMDKRFFVYMLGRGVPPPSNTFRWCTEQLKIVPMETAQEQIAIAAGMGVHVWDERYQKMRYRGHGTDKLLTLTGVRVGESAVRDQRISISCSKNGSECGQGWLQTTDRHDLTDTLAPILHWRVCHVWDVLTFEAPGWGLPTGDIAAVYGGDEKEEVDARTGCVGCNLASKDLALMTLIKRPDQAYLSPLLRLREIYAEWKRPENRIRKNGERRQDGTLAQNQGRMGPLTIDARRRGLEQILGLQETVNVAAHEQGRPLISLINDAELSRIIELQDGGTWPDGWDGTEQRADLLTEYVVAEGVSQPVLPGMEINV